MADVSTKAEARIRIAIKDALGQDVIISRLEQVNDVVHLDMDMPHGQQQQQALIKALMEIGVSLRQQGVSLVLINGKHSVFSPGL